MRVTIDPDLCEGNAVCEALAPMLFELDDADQARLLEAGQDGDVADEHRDLVERAAQSCPRLAISVTS